MMHDMNAGKDTASDIHPQQAWKKGEKEAVAISYQKGGCVSEGRAEDVRSM